MSEPKDLRGKVLGWLNDQGYPLEMRVASKLRAAGGFMVKQGWHYADPETETSREIDVVATAADVNGDVAIHFVVECKASTKPWIVFTSQHTTENYNRLMAYALLSARAFGQLNDIAFASDSDVRVEERLNLPWLWKRDAVAYSVAQAFDGKSDVPFVAVLSAVKAAMYCRVNSPQHGSGVPFVAVFPVVVTSSPLFDCSLGDDGQLNLVQVDWRFLFFQQQVADLNPILVAVVSEGGLDGFVAECAKVADKLMKDFLQPAADRMRAALVQNAHQPWRGEG